MDILIMGASISTIIGLVIAIITLRYLYVEKKEKLEYETKKAFYDGKTWTNEGHVGGEETMFFNLLIHDAPLHSFSGEIDDYKSSETVDIVYFNFEKSDKKTITLDVYKMSESQMYEVGKEFTYSLGKATVECVTPDLFIITFLSDCMPHLPRKTHIWT